MACNVCYVADVEFAVNRCVLRNGRCVCVCVCVCDAICVCYSFHSSLSSPPPPACFDHWVLSFRQKQNEGALSVCASWASKRSSLRRAFTAWVAVGRCARAQRAVQEHTRRFLIQRLGVLRIMLSCTAMYILFTVNS